MNKKKKIDTLLAELRKLYPNAECQLKYDGIPERLLIAVILSAQTTDVAVNKATPALWEKYPTLAELALAKKADVEGILRTIGLFRNKSDFIIRAARYLREMELPDSIDELIKIPGVGRKTANVIIGEIFGAPSITVDTHIRRLSGRLGLTKNTDPGKIEKDLKKLIPEAEQTAFCHRLITHGRLVCKARKPQCTLCTLEIFCPWKGKGSP